MFNYAEVAVEIWQQILLAVIDMPYVLDTLVDRENFHCKYEDRYHAPAIYAKSEHQRRTLRLVCHSWQDFADRYKYRWITYNTNADANSSEQEEAMAAILSAATGSLKVTEQEGTYLTSRPRRILFYATTDDDMEMLRTTIDHCAGKVTTFFIKCGDGYGDQVFEHLILRSSRLSMLRCLALPAPKGFSKPLRSLSIAFPKLITLTLRSEDPYELQDGDFLYLPDLEILKLDLSASEEASLKRWDLRGMIHLITPIGRRPGGGQMTFEPLRSLGVNLRFLNIHKLYVPIRLPVEFWAWCPCLMEFLASFSCIHFDTPAPPHHPLKYVVHWVYYDRLSNPFVAGNPSVQQPVLLQNLQFLPLSLEVFIVWGSWSGYLALLPARYSTTEWKETLIRMKSICEARSIRVEDRGGVTLDKFLEHGIMSGRNLLEAGAQRVTVRLASDHDLPAMLDCPGLAVEIWRYILLAVIDMPYVLDTLIDTEVALWKNSERYYNHDVYVKSEHQRKTLRLVCSSWRTFADEYRYRWITYDSRPEVDTRMQKEAVEAIELAGTSVGEGANMTCKPRRIAFHVSNDEDMRLFRKTIDHCSMKVTTFFVTCFDKYEDKIYQYVVVFHSSKLPMLRCLSLPPPNGLPVPLRALSSAFPKLLTFGIPDEPLFCPDEGDILSLPELLDLDLDLSGCKEMALKRWHLPRMINLTTVINEDFIGGGMGLKTIRTLGANLSYLDLHVSAALIRLPAEFWSWFPRLVELLACFTWVFLDSPAPASHPLKYVVHWPDFDNTHNPLIMEALDPTRLHSLQLLPPSVELFIVWDNWQGQLNQLTIYNRYSQIEQERVMVRMKDICAERSIRIEDADGVALEVFLASKGIGQGRIDSVDPNAVEPTES